MTRTINDMKLAGLGWTSKKGFIMTKLKIVGTWGGDRPDDRSSEVRTDLEEVVVRIKDAAGVPFLASYPTLKVDYGKGVATITAVTGDYGDSGVECFALAAETVKIAMEDPDRIDIEIHWTDEK